MKGKRKIWRTNTGKHVVAEAKFSGPVVGSTANGWLETLARKRCSEVCRQCRITRL